MPLYEYISENADDDDSRSCRVCSRGFELRRPADRKALENCPLCGTPVRKVISRVNSPRKAKPLSISQAKSAGFSVFEKRDEGVYERQ